MGRLPTTVTALAIETLRSPLAWASGVFALLGAYSMVRSEFYDQLPSLGSFMPVWVWIILALVLLLAASFHTNLRIAKAAQPNLLSGALRLLDRRRTQGFEIRKRAEPGWDEKAKQWYKDVLTDISLIRGADASWLFDLEIGRQPNIKKPSGERNPKFLINHTCDALKHMQSQLKQDEIQHSAVELRARIAAVLSP